MLNFNWELIAFGICIAFTAIQVFYYLYFFIRFAFYKAKQKKYSQQHPVSVVVCARDEAENLARNLPGILVQQYPSTFETIVVNDNSVDESKYIVEELQKTFKSLKCINLTQEAKLIAGKKYPLSIGIKEARHEVLLLTDADCVPATEHWIEKMQDGYHDDTEIVIGYGAYHKKKGLLNKLIRFETFHTAIQYFSYALAGIPYMGVGRNLSYKRNLFLQSKGFSSINNLPSGDDDLFVNKLANSKNTRIVINPESFTYSVPKANWKEWYRQKSRHFSTAKYYKQLHKTLLGLYGFSQVAFFASLLFFAVQFHWQWAVTLYAIRFLLQMFVYYISMRKLKENDLWVFVPILDLLLIIMYIIFIPSIVKKAKNNWMF